MDLEEWELLPNDGFLDIHEDGGKKFLPREDKNVFKMNYFICPSPTSGKIDEPPDGSRVSNQLVHVPIQLDPTIGTATDDEIFTRVPIEINILPAETIKAPKKIEALEADQDPVSQVFFKKLKENEFDDMKMDSLKSGSKGFIPYIDASVFQGEAIENNSNSVSKMKIEDKNVDLGIKKEEEITWEGNTGGLNIWKLSFTGIGALCSFGFAAATICIIIFQRNKQNQRNQKLRFQIYADDKRIKQVVHHATKLNEAISAVRGIPLTRAHITVGGYYEGL